MTDANFNSKLKGITMIEMSLSKDFRISKTLPLPN